MLKSVCEEKVASLIKNIYNCSNKKGGKKMRKKELLKQNKELRTELDKIKKLNKDLEYLKDSYKSDYVRTKGLLDKNTTLYDELSNKYLFDKVIQNKGATVVWFADKTKVVVKLAKGDKGSVYSAVAYAIAKRLYNNNTQFKKCVDEVLEK